MAELIRLLSGGDLHSIGKSNSLQLKISSQNDFDELFNCLFNEDRLVVMRAADAIEKITIVHPGYLKKHKRKILTLCAAAVNKELKWHIALLLPRLHLNTKETETVWSILTTWAKDKNNSRIVRVNSIQALFELAKKENEYDKDLLSTLTELAKEHIPSINARIRKIRHTVLSL
jgi:hypothetical protein